MHTEIIGEIIAILALLLIVAIIVGFSFYTISQQTVGIIERFGKFHKIAKPGFGFLIPIVDKIVERESLRIRQLDVKVSTKTKDNVFIEIVASTQFRVVNDDKSIYNAYYELENVDEQMNSYLFDVIRAEVPKLTVDEVFEKKDQIAKAIEDELKESIKSFGYDIVKTLVTDINVDKKIVVAMNDIVASEREKEAAIQKAEAEKILTVKNAEAEAESKKLQGVGIANQRKAIIEGFKESIKEMSELDNIKADEVLNLVLITQYFDTLKDVAQGSSNTIMLPGSPSGFSDISSQIRESIISANMVDKK